MTEFPVTMPFTYFRLNAQGRLQFGLSLMEKYEAKLEEEALDP